MGYGAPLAYLGLQMPVKALYRGTALPSHFFLDGKGVIRERYLGQLTEALMEEHLRSIVGS